MNLRHCFEPLSHGGFLCQLRCFGTHVHSTFRFSRLVSLNSLALMPLKSFIFIKSLNQRFYFSQRRLHLRCLVVKGLFRHKKTTDCSVVHLCEATSYSHRGKPPTTIGAVELNFRVRYGNGCDLYAIITRLFF